MQIIIEKPRCRYKFTRGVRKGELCNSTDCHHKIFTKDPHYSMGKIIGSGLPNDAKAQLELYRGGKKVGEINLSVE